MTNLDEVHPWQSAVDHWKGVVMPCLEMHGKSIGARATNGDQTCAEIIRLYKMLSASFDPMTAILLEEQLNAAIGGVDCM